MAVAATGDPVQGPRFDLEPTRVDLEVDALEDGPAVLFSTEVEPNLQTFTLRRARTGL